MKHDRRQRTNNIDLPDVHEVLQLLIEKESPRIGGANTWVADHPEVFQPVRKLAGVLRVSDMFDCDYTPTSEEGLGKTIEHVEKAKQAIITELTSGINLDESILAEVFSKLAEIDSEQPADIAFVFGAPSNARIELAVELYKKGLVPKIVISGRGPNWQKEVNETEARRMANRAIELGVPENDLMLEEQALTIPDNVKRTLDLFEVTGFEPKKVIIIASAWVLLRASIDWNRFPDKHIEIVRLAPPSIDPDMCAERWHTYEKGINLILNEYAKIIHETATNSLLSSN